MSPFISPHTHLPHQQCHSDKSGLTIRSLYIWVTVLPTLDPSKNLSCYKTPSLVQSPTFPFHPPLPPSQVPRSFPCGLQSYPKFTGPILNHYGYLSDTKVWDKGYIIMVSHVNPPRETRFILWMELLVGTINLFNRY